LAGPIERRAGGHRQSAAQQNLINLGNVVAGISQNLNISV
jgi:hypothetical protein